MPFELFFFFNDTATTEIYTLSLHDALPICDTVALMCLNAPGFVEALFGAWRLGAALMPVNHKLQAPELQYILDHAQCKALVFDAALAPVVAAAPHPPARLVTQAQDAVPAVHDCATLVAAAR